MRVNVPERSAGFGRFGALVLAAALNAMPVAAQEVVAYVGATLWDGTGGPAVPNATLVVQNGRVVAAGQVEPPPGARVESLGGLWIIPGLVDAHAHVSGRWAPEGTIDPVEQVRGDLRLYARYGVTTVASLGGEMEAAFGLRASNASPSLDHARLLVAGSVVAATDPEAARAAAAANAQRGADWIKMRVDDNLGTAQKMPLEAQRAVIRQAHADGLRVAAHLFYLEDARFLLGEGVDLIAHSVRDQALDTEVLRLMLERGVCYVPTLVREVSAFIYAYRPSFFDDPFFLEGADPREMARLSAPAYQQLMRESVAAQRYREALVRAQSNLARLAQAGVPIAFGTDAGPAGRFPGYFEHLELSLMVESGLTPEQALRSATGVAAQCLGLDDVGTLEPDKWADFVVLRGSPLDRIEGSRAIERVYVGGNRVR